MKVGFKRVNSAEINAPLELNTLKYQGYDEIA